MGSIESMLREPGRGLVEKPRGPRYLRDAKAVLETIETAGWTVVPQEAAQALDDSAALDALTGPRNGRP